MRNKQLLMIILLLFTILALSACSGNGNEVSDAASAASAESTSITADNADPNVKAMPQLIVPDYDFKGGEVNILVQETNGWLQSRDFDYNDGNAGEPINDAAKDRVTAVEEQFNCKLNVMKSSALVSTAQKDIMAGGEAYDFIMPALTEVKTIASAGLLVDLNKVSTLRFDNPWWCQSSVKDLSIVNKLFFALGDISIIDNDGVATIGFSKELISQNGLTTPYEHVYNNTWTFDTMHNMCKGMNRDLNGDGIMDKNDQYGFVNDQGNAVFIISATGERFVSKDENDIPYSTVITERMIKVVDKYLEFTTDENAYGKLSVFGGHEQANQYFHHNQMLFRMSTMFRFTQTREMESDFGFIPIPKYDENQENYYHAFAEVSPCISIPATVQNTEEIGAVIEALAYYGRTILLPAYYDITLQTKIARDDESAAMLDIIYDTATFDLGYVYNFSSERSIFTQCVEKGENIVSSKYAAIEESVNSQIKELVESYKALD